MTDRQIINGFTIVELLVVIVVIGILAAISLVSYTGITKKATNASFFSDLNNAKKQLSMYYTEYGSFPTTLSNGCPTAPSNDVKYCIKTSSGNSISRYNGSNNTFNLSITNGNSQFGVSNNSPIIDTTQPSSCPTGFIPVPGSATYNTNGFCAMKYEAKQVGSTNVPTSTATGLPWVSTSQTAAIANSPNTANCTGCHLISEAEWMTIAQNVLSVANNWNGEVIGTSYIFAGHHDNNPTNSIEASADDNDGYYNTLNTSPSDQRRTLTLTNGEVIWDIAGNVLELTSDKVTGNQPGITGGGFAWREFTSLTSPGKMPVDITPTGTGLSNASAWNQTTNHIGRIYSNSDGAVLRTFLRGGDFNSSNSSGVLGIIMNSLPSSANSGYGFRVAAPAQ